MIETVAGEFTPTLPPNSTPCVTVYSLLNITYVTDTITKAMIASTVAAKPSTASFEKKAKMISKNTPAKTHSFNLSKRLGVNSTRTPETFATPRMYIKCRSTYRLTCNSYDIE
jgi:hypothetical protein